ncbi:MAG: hypothetical protein KC589_11450 [Nanoarchaeota archaeon]|nr:hypothetical protein [Nanoarchaeota archaeon]
MVSIGFVREIFLVFFLLFGTIFLIGFYSMFISSNEYYIRAEVINVSFDENNLITNFSPVKHYYFRYESSGVEYEGFDKVTYFSLAKEEIPTSSTRYGFTKTFFGKNNNFYRDLKEGKKIIIKVNKNNPNLYRVDKLGDFLSNILLLVIFALFSFFFLAGVINPNYITRIFGLELK